MPAFLGVRTSSTVAVVQGAGFAESMSVADFRDSCKNGNKLPSVLLLFLHSLMTQISQSAACNRFHSIDARLARWLLMTSDRMHSDEFRITQEFLSNMLGVRREAVNKAAGGLQRKSFIQYNRGNLTILDRKELERTACPCYRMIKREYDAAAA
jgi:CRP-like cAMP-binding protein